MLDALTAPDSMKAATTASLLSGMQERADAAGVPFTQIVGGMFEFPNSAEKVTSLSEVMTGDADAFQTYFRVMLENGIYPALQLSKPDLFPRPTARRKFSTHLALRKKHSTV